MCPVLFCPIISYNNIYKHICIYIYTYMAIHLNMPCSSILRTVCNLLNMPFSKATVLVDNGHVPIYVKS